ncbi:MAG: hypothetical protein EA398_12325 [Deltaproteobacteria bacterium]|nr:MAG: hypothetical protein EA398_12325 [Deltaproteobacteria bacterium]
MTLPAHGTIAPLPVALFALLLFACTAEPTSSEGPAPPPAPADARVADLSPLPDDTWLSGDLQEQLLQLSRHMGGMGTAMLAVGQRHAQLYWAGVDENWAYAAYQLEELEEVIERALVRRPHHAEAGSPWLETAIPAMAEAIAAEDVETFLDGFAAFTVTCNACHGATGYAYIQVHPPEYRSVNVRPEAFAP